jgi:nicotinate-nucleotide--dimethylbenzimidazole phosphoribosyltransferase
VPGSDHLVRPPTPPGFDGSRAAERAADPRGWRYGDDARAAVHDVIADRRDIRRFRPDAVPADVVRRVLEAAHRAPSVGLMQPWRLIVVSDLRTRVEIRRLAQRERLRQADRFDERARQFLDQKIEGIVEAPLGICVCCDHGDPAVEILGRGTIPETDVYSTACAIENLWLAARAEGLGVGWVSFYRPDDLRDVLAIPARVDPIAYLCLGWPDERPQRPGLEAAGWSSRMALDDVVMHERWREPQPAHAQPGIPRAAGPAPPAAPAPQHDTTTPPAAPAPQHDTTTPPAAPAPPHDTPAPPAAPAPQHDTTAPPAAPAAHDDTTAPPAVPAPPHATPDRAAQITARDRLDALVKPAGSLGALEALIERWSAIAGAPPPTTIRAGVLVCAADHGHVVHRTSLFDSDVSSQVTAAAARGETAVGVLARRAGHELLVADVGLAGATPPGVRDAKVARGSADMLAGPALTPRELDEALAAGARLCAELAGHGVDCLVLGEIGIGNTATTAALACALTGAPPQRTVGRGTGLDAAGVERKRAVVAAAIKRHGAPLHARAALLAVGGLELAALAGAILEALERRLPVVLDGYAVGAAALAAAGLQPQAAEILIAAHRSSEPGHALVLAELGLEPLLDLRLRLGEASGALLALPLIEAAGALHREMATFAEAGVDRAR